MGQYLIDNNAISRYFSERLSAKAMVFIAGVLDETPNISVITEIEALSWVDVDKWKEAIVRDFVHEANIIGLTPQVVSKCIEIRRQKKIKTPDAIIAATAIIHKFSLISSDKDFDNIKGLQVIDPHLI